MGDESGGRKCEDEWINIEDPFARRLIESYLSRRCKDVEVLRFSLEKNEFEEIRIKGHNLCGSGSAYGLDRISELGRFLEDAATEKDRMAVASSLDALESYLKKVRVV